MKVAGRDKLALIFGVTSRTINDWEIKGMPHTSRGKGHAIQYETADCINWRVSGSRTGLQAEKERLTREQADAKEIENEQQRGELVPQRKVTQEILEQWSILITHLELLPGRLAASVAAMGADYDAAHTVIGDEIVRLRSELAAGLSKPAGGDVDPAPKKKRKRVGRPRKKAKRRSKRRTRAVGNK
jgi:hypothetical protein